MTNLERTEEIRNKVYFKTDDCYDDLLFMRKAFDVMREIAIQVHYGEYVEVPYTIDKEFEMRMKKSPCDTQCMEK